MLVHSVFFWLKPDLDDSQRADFRVELEKLQGIQAAEAVYVGVPAPTAERPVIDTSYDYCLTVLVKDVAAHDAYQVDPLHAAFIEGNKHRFERVQIYDAH